MIKWIFRLLVLAVVLVILVLAFTDTIVKEILVAQLNRRIGLESSIEKVDVYFLSSRIKIMNYVLYNSPAFGGSRFLEVPEITLEYDFTHALKGEVLLKLLRIDCSTVNIISDKLNRVNLEELFRIQASGGSQKSNSGTIPFFIQTMNISIGKIRLMNLEDPAHSSEVPLDLRNYVIHNVSSKDLNGTFLHNLILRIMLDSGKLEIRDGKFVLKSQ